MCVCDVMFMYVCVYKMSVYVCVPVLCPACSSSSCARVPQCEVYYTPCHTPGHVLYLLPNALFTGDTLFVAGCGRFNSGTPAQVWAVCVSVHVWERLCGCVCVSVGQR